MQGKDHIEKINALTHSARRAWLILLSVLLFVVITLMSIDSIDFFGVDRSTQLPLVNVSVPTRYFIITSPVLIFSIFTHFQLYLIRFWDALGAAPVRLDGILLGDAVTPWLVTDAAMYFRSKWRGEEVIAPRILEGCAAYTNLWIAFLLSPVVLFALWLVSMTARNFWLTGVAGVLFVASIFVVVASYGAMRMRIGSPDQKRVTSILETAPSIGAVVVLLPTVLVWSSERTQGPIDRLAPLVLVGENIVERSALWRPFVAARVAFRAEWCKQKSIEDCTETGNEEGDFENEFSIFRTVELENMRRPRWHKPGRNKPDLRNANLHLSFLVGINLDWADMEGANLTQTQMEGAYLRNADLQRADLSGAHMQRANLSSAQLQRAHLKEVQMEGANLKGAQMQGANLSGAYMQRTDLRRAQLQLASLKDVQMEGADLSYAQMQRADLSGAQIQGGILVQAQLQMADLFGAHLDRANLSQAYMQGVDFPDGLLEGAILDGALMLRANLSGTVMLEASLVGAQLRDALLRGAKLENANLRHAKILGTDLSGAQLQGANFDYSALTGEAIKTNELRFTNLSKSVNNGGMLRHVNLETIIYDQETDFRNAFLDDSVIMTKEFRAQMGNPCQWINTTLIEDSVFYGHWRGWIEASPSMSNLVEWSVISPKGYRNVEAIPPDPGCGWKSGPMPAVELE